jgi:predicted  nucleic acid-binding Zn-ribbon protein
MAKVNEQEIKRLEDKISKLEKELNEAKDRLGMMKPKQPLIYVNRRYDGKKTVNKRECFCPYCGEQLYIPKNKKEASKHKCGQMISWTWFEREGE